MARKLLDGGAMRSPALPLLLAALLLSVGCSRDALPDDSSSSDAGPADLAQPPPADLTPDPCAAVGGYCAPAIPGPNPCRDGYQTVGDGAPTCGGGNVCCVPSCQGFTDQSSCDAHPWCNWGPCWTGDTCLPNGFVC